MSEDIDADVPQEGDQAFPEDTENENSADSQSEKTDIAKPQSDEGADEKSDNSDEDNKGDAGFADHPRWKEREDDWKQRFNEQEKRHLDEMEKLRQEVLGKNEPTEVPAWFGGDEKAWKAYQQDINSRIRKAKEEARDEALKEFSSKSEAEQKKIEEATQYMNSQIDEIEKDKSLNPEGEKIDKNKLLKFVLDNELVDTKGRWNYKAGWKLMKSQKTSKDKKERKSLAGATTNDSHTEDKPRDYTTPEDFQNPNNRPW